MSAARRRGASSRRLSTPASPSASGSSPATRSSRRWSGREAPPGTRAPTPPTPHSRWPASCAGSRAAAGASPSAVRLLVTGGSGYLGGELLRRAPGAVGTALTGEADIRLDVRDPAAVAAAVGAVRPACVIHTAYARSGAAAWETNVTGARNVAVAAAAAGVRLVHLSTDVVFGGDAGRPYVEADPPRPVTDYGRSKAVAEVEVLEAHPRAAVVRTSLIYGGPEPS